MIASRVCRMFCPLHDDPWYVDKVLDDDREAEETLQTICQATSNHEEGDAGWFVLLLLLLLLYRTCRLSSIPKGPSRLSSLVTHAFDIFIARYLSRVRIGSALLPAAGLAGIHGGKITAATHEL